MPAKDTSRQHPSAAYMARQGLTPRDTAKLDQAALAVYALRERAEEWLARHAAAVRPSDAQVASWVEAREAARETGGAPIAERWWWETHGLILYGLGDEALWRPRSRPPAALLEVLLTPPPVPLGRDTHRPGLTHELGPTARGILAAIQAEGTNWQLATGGVPVYTWTEEDTFVSTLIQDPHNLPPSPQMKTDLWEMTRQLTDSDADVLLTALAHAFSGWDRQDDGSVWMHADAVLDYRHKLPKARRGASGGWTLERHRSEDRRAIAESMNRLDHLYVSIARRGTRRRSMKLEGKVLIIIKRIVQDTLEGADHSTVPLAWQYRVGDWMDHERVEPALSGLLEKAVGYDPYRQRWEKRLAMFIVLYGCVDGREERHVKLSVGQLLDNTQLGELCDAAHPAEARRRFERALDQLRADNVLVDELAADGAVLSQAWAYTPEGQVVIDTLPRYGWLPVWRQAQISLTLPTAARPTPVALTPPRKRGRPVRALPQQT